MTIIKLIDVNNSKKERIIKLFNSIKEWLYSKDFIYLLSLYGGNIDKNKDFEENLLYIVEFVKRWDFRIKLKGNNERWNIPKNIEIKGKQKQKALEAIRNLNMIDSSIPSTIPDYILVLGGDRKANYNRTLLAKETIDNLNIKNAKIVALTTLRPISEEEKDESYVDKIKYEYDDINIDFEKFLNTKEYEEKIKDNPNVYLNTCYRLYKEEYNNNKVYSLAAPSSDPTRRANSKDTFDYFFESFNIEENTSILLITSQTYYNYQFLRFADIAIDNNYNLECIGSSMNVENFNLNTYLQDIKSALDSIILLYNKYKIL